MQKISTKRSQLYLMVAGVSLAMCATSQVSAQENETPAQASMPALDIVAPPIDEMLVSGRLKSGAQSIIEERLDQAFAADLLGSEQIGRVGDANVASALLRVTGVTLIEDKFVYVRSLGERYSSTSLNGAAVPSPELTRNVLPLDLIPSSIVDSLKVQKAYSPDLSANFGGGNIDIRTKSIPDELVFDISIGTGYNSESSDKGLTYSSGGDSSALPLTIQNALQTYQGRVGISSIQSFIAGGREVTEEMRTEACRINRDLALSLNRDVDTRQKSMPLDFDIDLALGNAWHLGDDWKLGVLANASQDSEWRNKNQSRQGIGAPDIIYSERQRTVEEIRELYSINLGAEYQEMHSLALNAYQITNTQDEASLTRGFQTNFTPEDGSQIVNYLTRYEERELEIYQLLGEHRFDQLANQTLGELSVDWFYSDSEASTKIPNRAEMLGANTIDRQSGEVLSNRLLPTTSMAIFSFLELQDQVESYGWNANLPLSFGNNEVKLTAGYSYNDKARTYYGYTANINSVGVLNEVLTGTPGEVLGNDRLSNLDNPFELTVGSGLGTESYIAAQMTDAFYGMVDATFDYTWRITAGARYEDFKQALLPLDLLDYSGNSIQQLIEQLQEEDQTFAIANNDWYPSLAVTYMNEGFMNADNFQVRASFSQTAVRPDLREVSDVQYIDPELGIRVQGNPQLQRSELDHFDLRTEWFFSNGDNFTVSLFYKDISNPIEQSRTPASDDDILLQFYNADSGEIYGVEFEGLKELPAGFFVSSNLTLSKSEIVSPSELGFTNVTRPMSGQSEYVLNTQLGYDSDNGMHSVSLVYNVFGERVYYAARGNGHQDAYEQPFNSLNLVYSFYPTDSLTAKLKISNLLGEHRKFEQENSNGTNVKILQQDIGTSVGIDLSFSY